jgi:hypothetical protein
VENPALNALLPWKDIANEGGFTTTAAARLLGLPAIKLASWLRGNPPMISPDFPPIEGRPVMSFHALIEARAIAHFLTQGMTPQKMRAIMQEFRRLSGERHPLARDKQLVTDGFRMFERDGDKLINIANDVYAEPTILEPLVKGKVEYDGGRAAFLLPEPIIAPMVRIDPKWAFGRPVIFDNGRYVTTAALAASVDVDGLAEAADWFGVSVEAAEQATRYERQTAA